MGYRNGSYRYKRPAPDVADTGQPGGEEYPRHLDHLNDDGQSHLATIMGPGQAQAAENTLRLMPRQLAAVLKAVWMWSALIAAHGDELGNLGRDCAAALLVAAQHYAGEHDGDPMAALVLDQARRLVDMAGGGTDDDDDY